jgi:hypothetical protein
MPTNLSEIHLCSDAEIETTLLDLLRSGEKFTFGLEQGWVGEITNGEGLVWESVTLDKRILLLDVYAWLWFRAYPTQPSATSPWIRRRELSREIVTRRATTPEPEDLDPAEVQAVYEAHSHGSKK